MKYAILLVVGLLLCGCAKFPPTGTTGNTRVLFSMTVSGQINPARFYYVAIRWSKNVVPLGGGPIPVIGQPWGNGFVDGRANVFVLYSPSQNPPPFFQVNKFLDPIPDNSQPVNGQVYLSRWVPLGAPLNPDATDPKTLTFELDMSQIAENAGDIPLIQSLQVNFLTMDRVPQGSDTGKIYDGLGDTRLPSGINTWVTIPVTRDGLYNNSSGNTIDLEPRSTNPSNTDCPDPDIDLVDWSIEVRRP